LLPRRGEERFHTPKERKNRKGGGKDRRKRRDGQSASKRGRKIRDFSAQGKRKLSMRRAQNPQVGKLNEKDTEKTLQVCYFLKKKAAGS